MLIVWAPSDAVPRLPTAAIAGVDMNAATPTINDSCGSLKSPLSANTKNSVIGGPLPIIDTSVRMTETASKRQLIVTPNVNAPIDNANNKPNVTRDCRVKDTWVFAYRAAKLCKKFLINRPRQGEALQLHPRR